MRCRCARPMILNIVSIFLFNFVFWILNDYPKRLLQMSSLTDIVATLFNLAFFLLYFWVLMIVFFKNKALFSEYIFNPFEPIVQRFCLKRIALLIGIQISFDLLRHLLYNVIDGGTYVVDDIFILLSWMSIYLVLTYKKQGLLENKRILRVTLVSIAAVMIVCVIADVRLLYDLQTLSEKYEETSAYFQSLSVNRDFYHSLLNGMLDTILGAIIIVFHTISVRNDRDLLDEKEDDDRSKEGVKFSIRIGSLVFAAFVMMWIRGLIFPIGFLRSINMSGHEVQKVLYDGEFYEAVETLTLTRMSSYTNERVCYERSRIEIYRDGEKIGTFFSLKKGFSDRYDQNGKIIVINDLFRECTVNDQSVYLFKNQAICFLENGVPRVIPFEKISAQEKQELLIGVCRQLVSEGNMAVFEYSCSYLAQYDYAFLKPYLIRYSNGEYTAAEKAYIKEYGYRPEYFCKLAQTVLEQSGDQV